MKLPNGFGSVYKLSGKRRNPWVARKTTGWNDLGHPIYKFIGYYPTRKDALTALSDYNQDPWNVTHITFAEVYDRWSAEHFPTITQNNISAYKRAYRRCERLHNMEVTDIHLDQLQSVIDDSGLNQPSLKKIKSLYNLMWDYCIKHEILNKKITNYVDISKAGNPRTLTRSPFAPAEIDLLWQHDLDVPIFLIYTGLRIGEFYDLKWENVHLQEKYFDVVKSKTEAGIRSVPIHDRLIPILEKHHGSEYVFCNLSGNKHTDATFREVYWNRWMDSLQISHYPHDTRHTCISLLTEAGVDERIIKSIVGHKGTGVTQQVYTHISMDVKLEAINKIR